MNGGSIYNGQGSHGGAVNVQNGGHFIMNGGDIYNNKAYYDGGGIFLWHGSKATINGGSIRNNYANRGSGAIDVRDRATFYRRNYNRQ